MGSKQHLSTLSELFLYISFCQVTSMQTLYFSCYYKSVALKPVQNHVGHFGSAQKYYKRLNFCQKGLRLTDPSIHQPIHPSIQKILKKKGHKKAFKLLIKRP